MNADLKPGKVAAPDPMTLSAYVLTIFLAGANAVAVRFTVAELPPFWGAALRFSAAALIFWLILLLARKGLPTARVTTAILLYGLLGFGAGYAFIYWGLQSVNAGLAQVILALSPLLTFFFAFFHGLESFRWRGLIGAFIAMAGIAYAFFEQPGSSISIAALLAIIAGAACFAESIVILKLVPATEPLAINALSMTAGSVMLLLLSLVFQETWSMPVLVPTWLSIAYLVLIGSVVVFYLFTYVVRRWTASATSYQFVLFPFVTVLLGGWLAGEKVNGAFLLGGALVLIGVWVGAFSGLSGTPPAKIAIAAAPSKAD